MSRRRWKTAVVALLAGTFAATLLGTPSAPADPVPAPAVTERVDPARGAAAKPYLGWSSWSLQATNYPGVNPDGPGSFISEKNILAQARALASTLKPYGYEYVNIDAGWQDGADAYGRPKINTARFPHGIASVADKIHGMGLKIGIYAVVGIGDDAYDEGRTPIFGTSDCRTADIVYPDLRRTNGWDSALKIDFSNPCAQAYVDSIADLFASWEIDFLKLDAFGRRLLTNREVIAINQAGEPARPVDQRSLQQVWYAKHSDGSYTVALFNLGSTEARVTADLATLGIRGTAQVRDVWAGVDRGAATSVSAKLPIHGSKLYTITPQPAAQGVPATPVDLRLTAAAGAGSIDLAWRQLPNDRYSGPVSYDVYAGGRRLAAGISGTHATITGLDPGTAYAIRVRAVGRGGKSSPASVPIKTTTAAVGGPTTYEAEASSTTTTGSAGISGCSGCSGGQKIGNLGGGSAMTMPSITVPTTGTYWVEVRYTDGGAHRNGVITVNGERTMVNFWGSNDNDWDTPQAQVVPLHLKAGANAITIGNPNDYVSDIDALVV